MLTLVKRPIQSNRGKVSSHSLNLLLTHGFGLGLATSPMTCSSKSSRILLYASACQTGSCDFHSKKQLGDRRPLQKANNRASLYKHMSTRGSNWKEKQLSNNFHFPTIFRVCMSIYAIICIPSILEQTTCPSHHLNQSWRNHQGRGLHQMWKNPQGRGLQHQRLGHPSSWQARVMSLCLVAFQRMPLEKKPHVLEGYLASRGSFHLSVHLVAAYLMHVAVLRDRRPNHQQELAIALCTPPRCSWEAHPASLRTRTASGTTPHRTCAPIVWPMPEMG